jgi:hypothetical protein
MQRNQNYVNLWNPKNKVLKSKFFIVLSCGQLNLEPQSTIRNFKKASHDFKIIVLFSLKDI